MLWTSHKEEMLTPHQHSVIPLLQVPLLLPKLVTCCSTVSSKTIYVLDIYLMALMNKVYDRVYKNRARDQI